MKTTSSYTLPSSVIGASFCVSLAPFLPSSVLLFMIVYIVHLLAFLLSYCIFWFFIIPPFFWCFWTIALTHKAWATSPWFPKKKKKIYSLKKSLINKVIILKKKIFMFMHQIVYLIIKYNCVRSFIFGTSFTLLNNTMVLNLCRDFHWNLMT